MEIDEIAFTAFMEAMHVNGTSGLAMRKNLEAYEAAKCSRPKNALGFDIPQALDDLKAAQQPDDCRQAFERFLAEWFYSDERAEFTAQDYNFYDEDIVPLKRAWDAALASEREAVEVSDKDACLSALQDRFDSLYVTMKIIEQRGEPDDEAVSLAKQALAEIDGNRRRG